MRIHILKVTEDFLVAILLPDRNQGRPPVFIQSTDKTEHRAALVAAIETEKRAQTPAAVEF